MHIPQLSVTVSSIRSSSAPIVLQGDWGEQIAKAKALGYHQVELHIRNPKSIDADSILHVLDQTAVQVPAIGTGQTYSVDHLSFSSLDMAIRQAAVQRIKEQIRLASFLKAQVIMGSVRGSLPKDEPEQKTAYDVLVDCIKDCLDEAERYGVDLSLEAINRYETNVWNSAAETAAFIQGLGSKRLGLHLDTFHMNIEEVSLEETIREHGRILSHIHLADSNRLAPGQGHIDFPQVIGALKDVGYRGSLGLEYLPLPEPETAATQGLDHLQSILKTVYSRP